MNSAVNRRGRNKAVDWTVSESVVCVREMVGPAPGSSRRRRRQDRSSDLALSSHTTSRNVHRKKQATITQYTRLYQASFEGDVGIVSGL